VENNIIKERIENRIKDLKYKIEVCEMRIEVLKEEFIKTDRHIILMEKSGVEEKINLMKDEIFFLEDILSDI
jgi:hypothetical protein